MIAQIKAVASVAAALVLIMSPAAFAGSTEMLEDASPTWILVIERFGISTFLVVFVCAVVWRVTPHLIELVRRVTGLVSSLDGSVEDIRRAMASISSRLDRIEQGCQIQIDRTKPKDSEP